MVPRTRISLFFTILQAITAVKGTCYLPDGTALDATYEACNTTAPVSMCCHLAFSNNGGDLCGVSGTSEYGLCGVTAELFRDACTDHTWTDPACLKLCIGSDYANDTVPITKCNDGSYCCGQNNATCCTAEQGVWIVNDQIALTSPISTTSPTSSTVSSTSPISTTSHSTTSGSGTPPSSSAATTTVLGVVTSSSSSGTSIPTRQPQSQGLSSGAKAGIGIGVSLGALALVVAGLFMLWRRKRSEGKDKKGNNVVPAVPVDIYAYERDNKTQDSRPNFETLPQEQEAAELDGWGRRHELSGSAAEVELG